METVKDTLVIYYKFAFIQQIHYRLTNCFLCHPNRCKRTYSTESRNWNGNGGNGPSSQTQYYRDKFPVDYTESAESCNNSTAHTKDSSTASSIAGISIQGPSIHNQYMINWCETSTSREISCWIICAALYNSSVSLL